MFLYKFLNVFESCCVIRMEYGRRNRTAFRIQVEKGKRRGWILHAVIWGCESQGCGPVIMRISVIYDAKLGQPLKWESHDKASSLCKAVDSLCFNFQTRKPSLSIDVTVPFNTSVSNTMSVVTAEASSVSVQPSFASSRTSADPFMFLSFITLFHILLTFSIFTWCDVVSSSKPVFDFLFLSLKSASCSVWSHHEGVWAGWSGEQTPG